MKQSEFTNSVNISDAGCWEIIINNQIHSLEVDTAAHEFCTYQNPDLKADKILVKIKDRNLIQNAKT
jgi:PIN domain nuclease of toxin-antitoxin system